MIAYNAAAQMAALATVLVVQTTYIILVARILGPEDFGRFSFAWALVQMLLIAGDLGTHNTVIREVSAQPQQSERITQDFFFLKLVLGLVLFLIVAVCAGFLKETAETRVALLLFGVGMLFHSLSLGVSMVFQAHGKLYWGSLNVVVVFVFQFLIGISLLVQGGGLPALGFAYLGAALVALAANCWIFSRRIHPIHLKRPADWRQFMRKSLPVGLGNLFQNVSSRIGVTLLTLLAGPLATGIFSAANRITLSMSNVPIGIFSAFLPVMASHQKDAEPVRRLFRRSVRLMGMISVPLACFFFFAAEPLIKLIYSQRYLASIQDLRLLAWSVVPVFVGMAFSHVLLSQNRLVGRYPIVTGIGMTVSMAANFLLIPRLGSTGAAWSVVITEVVMAAGYVVAVRRFLFHREDAKARRPVRDSGQS